MSGALDRELRKELANAVRSARRIAEAGAKAALGALRVGAAEPDPAMSEDERLLRRRLRAHGRGLGDRRQGDAQETTRLAHEVAYEHWHRMLFARFLAENDLLIEPESGLAVSLDECRELARERNAEMWTMVGGFAERMLPRIFRADDPSLAVRLAPETQQAFEQTLNDLPAAVFRADDALGWTYQFWQTDRKDEVNKSGARIGADELPAVTQLFTERYMVRFLFHNTVGAWRAGKMLALRRELAESAVDEAALREAVRIEATGGYEFDYLRFVRESPDRDADQPGRWRPASGSFAEWPRRARDLKVLDPCCGSGHFLVEGLHIFVRLRMEEENLSLEEAICVALRDNLYGLEIDARCAQIAAFAVAFTAWKLAGRVIELPPLNIACSGIAPNATEAEWLAAAKRMAEAAGADVPRQTLTSLHRLFTQAPVRGSLIEPRKIGIGTSADPFGSLRPILEAEAAEPDYSEHAVAAAGMVRAANLLMGAYSLVITNVPYLARGRQDAVLRTFAAKRYPASKGDLATMFVERAFGWIEEHGTSAVVVPQNWLFLKTYRRLREELLTRRLWRFVARLGPGAFETIGGHVVNVALLIVSTDPPDDSSRFAGLDVSVSRDQTPILASDKARILKTGGVRMLRQQDKTQNPEARVTLREGPIHAPLSRFASSYQGVSPADFPRFGKLIWEKPASNAFRKWQGSPDVTTFFSGRHRVLYWGQHLSDLFERGGAAWRGRRAAGQDGIAVNQMSEMPATVFSGEVFDTNVAAIIPRDQNHLGPIWCFIASPDYRAAVRELDQKLNVTNATLVDVPFDLDRWKGVAAERYPNGLPEPYSDDPTQWIFHGHPCASVVWNPDAKRTAEGPTRTDKTVLHVAVARLLGYRWPAEDDSEMRLADESRTLVRRCAPLESVADQDGIVCLPALRGEARAADRLRSLLVAAYGDAWSTTTEQQLLRAAKLGTRAATNLDDWLRNHFFEGHCRLFHHRPFIWHIWDGLPDGFSALINYHRLAGPNGEGRRTLESLTYSYLGDWIERQQAAVDQETPGSEARLAAALELKAQLEAILTGAPPLDLFIRWKPLREQPIGWDPDINDGVRLNIRPFLRAELRKGGKKGAGILRARPNIRWTKDRGTEPQHLKPKRKGDDPEEYRPKTDYPWFWSCPGEGTQQERTDFSGNSAFDGARWNDLHYTATAKRAARNQRGVGPEATP